MKKDENCIFCKIIDGKIPCAKIYEDERTLAFLDISPVNLGHTLIVPKNHSRNLLEDSDEDLASLIISAKKIGKAIMVSMKAEGFNLESNIEKAAGQAVFHTHMHIIPRFSGDGLKHWPQGKYEEGQIEAVRRKIEANIN
jgi:histidine triad (HIT) family protein